MTFVKKKQFLAVTHISIYKISIKKSYKLIVSKVEVVVISKTEDSD